MAHRQVSDIIDDMILQRVLSCCTDDKDKIKAVDCKLEELKHELEVRLGVMVLTNVREIKDAGLI